MDCWQFAQSLIDRTPAGLTRASAPDNVEHFSAQLRTVQVAIQLFFDLVDRPCRAAARQPVGIYRGAFELFIGRITPRRETAERLVNGNQAPGFDPAVNLP
jgi:hypothetical protein